MRKYVLEGHVDQDGNLALNVPTGLPETNVRVEVSVEPMEEYRIHPSWPPEFFQNVVGQWAGEIMERPPQPELEERDFTGLE